MLLTLNDLAAIATIIQAILVVASLVLILIQLRQNADLAKAANAHALVEQTGSFNALLIQDKDLTRLWYSYGEGISNQVEVMQYRDLLVQWLMLHENIYYQYTKKLLDKRVYQSWLVDLKSTVHEHNMGLVAYNLVEFFPGGFGQHLTELVNEPYKPIYSFPVVKENKIE